MRGPNREVTVVKIGGSTLGAHDTTIDDLAALHRKGLWLVVVHGGGNLVTQWLAARGLEPRFVRGLRVTDTETLEVVVAVLGGLINRRLVADLGARGTRALGLTGADAGLLRARRADPELGLVGVVEEVESAALRSLLAEGFLPVVASLAVEAGSAQLLNVNADDVAADVACALEATRLVYLTDVAGVRNGEGRILETLRADEAAELVARGAVEGGMIPKVEGGIRAATQGVATVIADGRQPGTLAQAVMGQPVGTRIMP